MNLSLQKGFQGNLLKYKASTKSPLCVIVSRNIHGSLGKRRGAFFITLCNFLLVLDYKIISFYKIYFLCRCFFLSAPNKTVSPDKCYSVKFCSSNVSYRDSI